jgi:hypothetical protein
MRTPEAFRTGSSNVAAAAQADQQGLFACLAYLAVMNSTYYSLIFGFSRGLGHFDRFFHWNMLPSNLFQQKNERNRFAPIKGDLR